MPHYIWRSHLLLVISVEPREGNCRLASAAKCQELFIPPLIFIHRSPCSFCSFAYGRVEAERRSPPSFPPVSRRDRRSPFRASGKKLSGRKRESVGRRDTSVKLRRGRARTAVAGFAGRTGKGWKGKLPATSAEATHELPLTPKLQRKSFSRRFSSRDHGAFWPDWLG